MAEYTKNKLLYKSKVEYVDWTINHLKGCAHACVYCYAYSQAKRYGQVQNEEEWRDFQIVSNALEILDKEIPKLKTKIGNEPIHMCFTTDPFMYDYSTGKLFPEVKNLSLQIIKKLNLQGLRVETLTKGYYPLELLNGSYGKNNLYGITLTSLNEKYKEKWERYSAPYDLRIRNLRFLSLKKNYTWVSIEPYPTPNIVRQDLIDILESISFVDKIVFGKMNYVPKVNHYPHVKEFYEQCVQEVIDFCTKKNISYHIKEKTPRPKHTPQTNILQKNIELRKPKLTEFLTH